MKWVPLYGSLFPFARGFTEKKIILESLRCLKWILTVFRFEKCFVLPWEITLKSEYLAIFSIPTMVNKSKPVDELSFLSDKSKIISQIAKKDNYNNNKNEFLLVFVVVTFIFSSVTWVHYNSTVCEFWTCRW